MTNPTHFRPGGGFHNPWPGNGSPERGLGALLRWQMERFRGDGVEPNPPAGALPVVAGQVARPRAAPDELRVTWVGHSTLLLQAGGWNVLTDPIWSERASPVQWAGPARLVPPALAFDDLPPLDAVVISHDHYDHLDRATVARLHERFGDALGWFAPLGFAPWFHALGIRNLRTLDWWHAAVLPAAAARPAGLRLTAVPAQHWSRRSPLERRRDRLWCGWVIHSGDASVYFAGDTGYFPVFPEIAARLGPFDAVALPIGAYAPRWFMSPAHMDPEEAVRAYAELGGGGAFVPTHWGTFRLTDEPILEPPRLLRDHWLRAALPESDLALLSHGGTLARTIGRK